MKPVYQTIIDKDIGDCLRACVASLLEMPIEVVPNFRQEAKGSKNESGIAIANRWLVPLGLGLFQTEWMSGESNWSDMHNVHCIFTVPSQRFPDKTHSVVGRAIKIDSYVSRWEIVHDPNPTNKPYKISDVMRVAFVINLCN